jgi:tripartite-type tricarboxylate transporter receptor subunit TctC
MNLNRRQSIAVIGAAATPGWLSGAHAQGEKKLTMIVGFPPGGAPDTVARAIGTGLRNQGYLAVVENKSGAGGRLAADALLGAPPETAVLLMPSGNLTIYPHIYSKLRYDWARDFAPLATACEFQFALAVGAAVPSSVETLSDFVGWCKANGRQAQFGTPGAGTAMHFIGVELARELRIELQHIPYRGGAPALADAIGGTVPAVLTTLPLLVQPHKANRIRILAHSGSQRVAAIAEVPTFKEAGLPSLTMSEMFIFVASKKMPAPVQKHLASALSQSAAMPNVKAALEAAQFDLVALPPEAIAARLQTEHERWGAVVRATGYKSDD